MESVYKKVELVALCTIVFVELIYCANVPLEGRIVGGKVIDITMCAYQVSLRLNDQHICGGAILSPNSILTAAHCTDGQAEGSLSIRHGSTYADYGTKHEVIEVIQHPDFYAYLYENDAAVLKINPPIKFSRSSQPARLATTRSADNSEALICGWGVQAEYDDAKDLGRQSLRAVVVRVVNREFCRKAYHNYRNDDNMICAAARNKDSCQGDSGGGLLDMKKRQLIGISSYGDGCAKEGKPGIYGSVPDMLSFIKKNM